ncbi:MAG: S41 family peptidase [Bacteroidota bacterium]
MDRLFQRYYALLLLTYCFPYWGIAQETKPQVYTQKIPVAALHQDLAILQENLKLVHTGLYAYNDEATLDQAFLSVKEAIQEPITALDFYRQMTPLLPVIANGHTQMSPPRAYEQAAPLQESVLPFLTYWDRDTLYITKNLSNDESILPRTAILSINGESTRSIIERLMATQTRDGFNKTLPRRSVTNNFIGWYARMIGSPETFELEVIDPKGQAQQLTVAAHYAAEMRAIYKNRYGTPKKSFWQDKNIPTLELAIDGKIATLTIRTFSMSFTKKYKDQKFKPFFKEAFEKIERAGVEHLILDLRSNGGGDPKPTVALLAHLIDEEFTFYKDITALQKKLPNKQYYVDQPVFWHNTMHKVGFKKRGNSYAVKETGLTRLFGAAGLKPTKPAKTVYQGELYVLTNAASFSATGETIAVIKDRNLATFIGEEAGGNPNQNTSGTSLMMELPNSKCLVEMPFWLFEMNVDFENTGHSIIPDYPVRNTIDDVLAGRDAVMAFTLGLIAEQEGKE